MKKVYIIAGESSGDIIGAHLIDAMKSSGGEFMFLGVGGPLMEETGFKSLFPMADIAVMGILAVLFRIFKIKKRLSQTEEHIRKVKPDIIITIDSPGFNNRIAFKVKDMGVPLVHYVAPSVWVWKPERAKTISKIYDHLLCLLPFEPKYFIRHGLKSTFVGHPIIESGIENVSSTAFFEENNIDKNKKIFCLLPGSRASELRFMLPIYKKVVSILNGKLENVVLVIPTVPHLVDIIKSKTMSWAVKPLIVEGRENRYKVFKSASIVLAASGTVSLELSLAKAPTIIVYQISLFTRFLLRKIIKRQKYASIVNILANKMLLFEFLFKNAKPKLIAEKLLEYYNNKSSANVDEVFEVLNQLRSDKIKSPSQIASEVILSILNNKG